MMTFEELLRDAKGRTDAIDCVAAASLIGTNERAVFLDVREEQEYNLGKIPGAKTLSRGKLEEHIEQIVDRSALVIVYCASGDRSILAASRLAEMGYDRVFWLSGGFREWVQGGRDVD